MDNVFAKLDIIEFQEDAENVLKIVFLVNKEDFVNVKMDIIILLENAHQIHQIVIVIHKIKLKELLEVVFVKMAIREIKKILVYLNNLYVQIIKGNRMINVSVNQVLQEKMMVFVNKLNVVLVKNMISIKINVFLIVIMIKNIVKNTYNVFLLVKKIRSGMDANACVSMVIKKVSITYVFNNVQLINKEVLKGIANVN